MQLAMRCVGPHPQSLLYVLKAGSFQHENAGRLQPGGTETVDRIGLVAAADQFDCGARRNIGSGFGRLF